MAFKGMRDVDTVGEMVETEASARFLCDVGVQYGQGYLFGRPIWDITGWRSAERGRAAAAQ